MYEFKSHLEFAQQLDQNDHLREYRSAFHIPKDENGKNWLYFTGNSLGLQPKSTKIAIEQELSDWANLGVEGHFHAKNPWMPYHEFLTDSMAKIVGAKPIEVVVMNTLTANLHFLMVSFYNPTPKRHKILIESDAFPSDRYAVQTQLSFHGYSTKDSLVEWSPPEGETLLRIEDLEEILENQGNEIALILVGGVNYYTGQYLDLKKIAKLGYTHGCKVGIDLAHGAGNIEPQLHDSGVDFAAWCTYKYLNAGPGSLGGVFVHERYSHDDTLKRFAGWWSQNKFSRFNMRQPLDITPGAEGWQLSNPPILSMAAIKASLELFNEVGMPALRQKSIKLTAYLEYLIKKLKHPSIKIITPSDPNQRGCQLSFQIKNANRKLHEQLIQKHVITDWREPDVIRCAPVPFYNSFQDVFDMIDTLKYLLK